MELISIFLVALAKGMQHMGCRFSRFLATLTVSLILAYLPSGSVFANVIDKIDINRVDDNAEIVIRFGTEIQYLRHGPEQEGKFLRVFFRVLKPGFVESEMMQEGIRSPASPFVPRFQIVYPELVNGMLISFDKPVKYTLRPGGDAKSIVLVVPIPEDKRQPVSMPTVSKSSPKVASKEKPTSSEAPVKDMPKGSETSISEAKVVVAAPVSKRSDEPASVLPAQPEAAAVVGDGIVAPVGMTKEQLEELSSRFYSEARAAFEQGDYPTAINRLNRLLGLPLSRNTENAQALMGEVREKNGEIAKAKAEYELYLKLFPSGAEVNRVRQRLAALPASDLPRKTAPRSVDQKPAEWTTYGSVASYWFNGRSSQDGGSFKRDQNMLVTSTNLNARLRDGVTDTRIVFRDTDSRNFLRENRDYNRIYSAYVERTDRDVGYFVRVGRQNPSGGGVLDRFDGVSSYYNLNQDWRLNAVAGTAVEFKPAGFGGFNMPANRKFYGGGVEFLPQLARPGVSLYAIEQTQDGYLNRQALGSEVRYFDGQFNAFGMLDYDTLYNGINIGMAQGNYTDPWGNNYFVSYDYRKTPTYSLSNALQNTAALGISTVPDLVSTYGLSQSRQMVVDSTPSMSMFGSGVTVPIGEKWQLGFDYRASKVSGSNAVIPLNQVCKSLGSTLDPNDPICVGGPLGDVPVSQMCSAGTYDSSNNTCLAGQRAQGLTSTYTFQAIATNLLTPGGVGVAVASFNRSSEFSGENYGLNYIFPFAEVWRLEGNLRYFASKNNIGSSQTNFNPSIKLGYQWRNSLFLEGEIGVSDQKTTGVNAGENKREYLFFGIRWDFR